MGGNVGRIATGLGTFGFSEGWGWRPAIEGVIDKFSPDVPVPQVPRSPSTSTRAVQQAAGEAATRRHRARGFRSTILTNLTDQSNRSNKLFDLTPQNDLKTTMGS